MGSAARERLYRYAVGVGDGPVNPKSDYCNGCERTIRLRKDGTFQAHNVRTLSLRCPGGGLTPQETAERDLWNLHGKRA
jgi:hypothetical protein